MWQLLVVEQYVNNCSSRHRHGLGTGHGDSNLKEYSDDMNDSEHCMMVTVGPGVALPGRSHGHRRDAGVPA